MSPPSVNDMYLSQSNPGEREGISHVAGRMALLIYNTALPEGSPDAYAQGARRPFGVGDTRGRCPPAE